ncbi:MAG: biotin--[acetyl-CoA-carboxylase] ligase [Candidatus Thorarchaeota archaeon]|nr:MAG: biotin--[acetyl-CoA-carboxylase] ligase [Candidatus Thorarchaeota archaeon]
MFDSKAVERLLEELPFKPAVIFKKRVDSTNATAKQMLQEGADHGTIIVAAEQTKGRGRYDRIWYSPPKGLYMTVILKPHLDFRSLGALSLLAGCAVADAIENTCGTPVKLKWPNDVLMDNQKVAGILSEAVIGDVENGGVVIGIGINQNTEISDYPPELREHLTTILTETGQETSNEELVALAVIGLLKRVESVEASGSFEGVIDEWRSRSSTLKTRVIVEDGVNVIEGVAKNVDQEGSLIIETSSGILEKVSIGDVTHLRLPSDE